MVSLNHHLGVAPPSPPHAADNVSGPSPILPHRQLATHAAPAVSLSAAVATPSLPNGLHSSEPLAPHDAIQVPTASFPPSSFGEPMLPSSHRAAATTIGATTGAPHAGSRHTQRHPPTTHIYHQGRSATFFLNWMGKTQLIVVPHQRVFKLTEFYPMDLAFLFQEVYMVLEKKRIYNFSLQVIKRDWNVAPHLFLKVQLSQTMYAELARTPYSIDVATGGGAAARARALDEHGLLSVSTS